MATAPTAQAEIPKSGRDPARLDDGDGLGGTVSRRRRLALQFGGEPHLAVFIGAIACNAARLELTGRGLLT